MLSSKNVPFTKEMDRLHMNILDAAYSRLDPGWHLHLCSSFTRIYMVRKGEGVLCADRQTVTMRPGHIYLVPAGLSFDTACPESMEKLYFHINILRYNRYDLFEGHPRIITLADCMPQIEASIAEHEKADMNSAFSLKLRLWQIVAHAVAQEGIEWGSIEVYSQTVKAVMRRIETDVRAAADGLRPDFHLTVQTLADVVRRSPGALQKEFRSQVGVPLRRYINDRILVAAEQELRAGQKSIAQISESLGFCDPFYFSRCFSARYGLSPRDYRKNRT